MSKLKPVYYVVSRLTGEVSDPYTHYPTAERYLDQQDKDSDCVIVITLKELR